MIIPDVLWLVVNSMGRAADIEDYTAKNGKFSQFAVLYVPFSPPPLFWDYKCKKCRFWQSPDSCTVVEGRIAPRGWRAVWLPPDNYKAFPGRGSC
jgi:hypothetical protein